MEDSSTYQIIIARGEERGMTKGQVEEARRLLLRLGEKRFGPANEATQAAIQSLSTVEELEALAERLLEVENWSELLS